MAEAVVSIVVEQLADLLLKQAKEEIDLLTGVEHKVRHLSKTFERIQAVLVDAERKRITEESVKIWLQELEDVSYEIDDVLDEWNYQILRKQIEGSSSTTGSTNNINASTSNIPKQRVCSFVSSSCFCFKQVVVNREIAIRIKELNAKLDVIEKEKHELSFIDISAVASSSQEWRPLQSTSLIDETEVYGRVVDKNILISHMLSKSRQEEKHAIQILSIIGTGGIGKTTLAQLAYNNDQVNDHFEIKAWACVSHPFDEIRVAKAILESLELSSPNLNELNSLLQRIRESVSGKRFLVVLDDVWIDDRMKWEPFKNSLNHGALGSTILLTTRNKGVAIAAGATLVIPVDELSDSDSWALFRKVAFFGRTKVECERLESLGWEIASKCKGLPLAIKTIGSHLCFKNAIEAWQEVKDSNIWQLEVAEVELFPHLYLSYNDLPSPLKRCFSYCAVFPKGYRINVDGLIRIWMGQGYINSSGSEEMELKGREYFEHLVMRSFFQEFEKDHVFGERIVTCKMHDIVHDFAQFLTKRECLIVEAERKEIFNARHITWLSTEKVIDTMGQPRTCFAKNLKLETIDTHLLNSLKLVRVLKLDGCGFKELPRKIGDLIHLRYLGLGNNYELEELPTTLYDLYNLQTLDLNGCWKLIKLPPGIEKLKKLRHLYPSRGDMNYPERIGELTCLQTLISFMVGREYNKLGYLKSLNQLRGELFITINDNLDVKDVENADLKSKKQLQELKLEIDNSIREKEDVIEALEPPLNLQSLYVIRYGGTRAPTWMTSLNNVRCLVLKEFSKLTSLPSLGVLPSLEKLEIHYLHQLKFVGPTFLGIRESLSSASIGFSNLRDLEFIGCEEWEEWEDIRIEGDNNTVPLLPRLCWLRIDECTKLKALPYHLLHKASSLECIQLDGKKYNPSTILSIALPLAEVKSRQSDYQSSSTKEASQLKSFPKKIADVWSKDSDLQREATLWFSDLLSRERIPIEEVIRSGVVPRFIEFLTREDSPLLQFSATRALELIAVGSSENIRVVIDHGAVPNFVKLLGSPTDVVREQAVLALGIVAGDSPECRDLVLGHGAMMPLLSLLNEHAKLPMLRYTTWTLFKFCRGEPLPQFEQIKQALPVLQRLIYSNDELVLRDACYTLSHLSKSRNEKILAVIEDGVCQRLVELLFHPSPFLLIPTLQTVGNIVARHDPQTQRIIDNKALPRLLSLLTHNHEESNSTIKAREKDEIQYQTAWTLANIAYGSSKNRSVLIDDGTIPIFVKLLGSPSNDVREQAVLALGYIANDSPMCRDLVLGNGALMPLVHLLDEAANLSLQINATWTLASFCRCKPQPQFEQVKSTLQVLQRLIYANDEEVLRNVCWSLSYMSDGMNDKIQAIIEAGICQRLVELLNHPSSSVLNPALITVGNIVTGEDLQTQYIIDHGALPCLLSLLTHDHEKSIKINACWTISNITAGNKDQIQAVIEAGLIASLVNPLQIAEFDMKTWAALAISNATSGGTHEQIKFLVSEGCIKLLCDLLVCPYRDVVTVCLKGLENILKVGEVEKNLGNTGEVNYFVQLIQEAEGLEKIKNLQSYEKAVEILQTYWSKEDKTLPEGKQAGLNFKGSE